MNVQSKPRDPSMFVQLDIFNYLEEEKKEAIQNIEQKRNPIQLIVGDIVEFVSYTGNLVKGTFVTRGFWDGRDQKCPHFYYFDIDGHFQEMNPKVCAWNLIGHDDTYTKPDKHNITERLIKHLKNIPFLDRLGAFRRFENEYPYLSFEYHPYVSAAWDKAIVEVTIMEEVISNLKHWSIREKFPKEAKQYIAEKILPLNGEKRLAEMIKMEWQELAYRKGNKKVYWSKQFADKNITVYEPLLRKLIKEANTPQELINVASIWGTTSKIVK